MGQLQYEEKSKIIPLLIRFRQPINQPEKNYSYNESLGLNCTFHDGQCTPVVLIPGSLAEIKTVIRGDGGED